MIALVEGASRKKTPNEIALNTLLVSLTIIFLIVVVTLYPMAVYSGVHLPLSVALFWLGSTVPVQAVQTFTTLTERVVVLRRVPLDCALLAFAVCCITVEVLSDTVTDY